MTESEPQQADRKVFEYNCPKEGLIFKIPLKENFTEGIFITTQNGGNFKFFLKENGQAQLYDLNSKQTYNLNFDQYTDCYDSNGFSITKLSTNQQSFQIEIVPRNQQVQCLTAYQKCEQQLCMGINDQTFASKDGAYYASTNYGGRIHKPNEDGCFVNTGESFLAVADGIGGGKEGQKAARLSLSVFNERKTLLLPMETIFDKACENLAQNNMGSMQEGAMLVVAREYHDDKGRGVEIGHVGDVRAYVIDISTGTFAYISEDQSTLTDAIDAYRQNDMLKIFDMIRERVLMSGVFNDEMKRINSENFIEALKLQFGGRPHNAIDSGGLSMPVVIKKIPFKGTPLLVLLCSDGLIASETEILSLALEHGKNASRKIFQLGLERQKELANNNNIERIDERPKVRVGTHYITASATGPDNITVAGHWME